MMLSRVVVRSTDMVLSCGSGSLLERGTLRLCGSLMLDGALDLDDSIIDLEII